VNSLSISNDWSLLESQAAALTNIDLIVKGTLDGQLHGWLYQPGASDYRPDTTNLSFFTRVQLLSKVQGGDTLSIMGVPPGSGVRMGIDRDLDGVLDADVPPPSLNIAPSENGVVLYWPYSSSGYVLESTPTLSSATWTAVPDPVEILGNQNYVTNPPATDASFYRLRLP
jgi:hypothetical protein